MAETERTLAVFIDFENLAIGFKHRRGDFDIHKVLERLVEKGKIIVKKAYADWGEFEQYTRPAARDRHRVDRDPPPADDRQELGRHPAGRRRDGPRLVQGAHRHLRDRLRRLRLLAARLQAQGERQARHRPRHEGVDLRPAVATTATSSSTTRTWRSRPPPAAPGPQAVDIPADEERGLRSAARIHRRPHPREQGPHLRLDGQGHDAAQEAVVQRVGLRLPQLQQSARSTPRSGASSSSTATRRPAGPTLWRAS